MLFNITVGVLGAIGGWVLNNMWISLRDLQEADRALTDKLATIEVLVAGKYMTREEFQLVIGGLYAKLDKLNDNIVHLTNR